MPGRKSQFTAIDLSVVVFLSPGACAMSGEDMRVRWEKRKLLVFLYDLILVARLQSSIFC